MNQLQNVFNYENQQVRTVIKDGEPWFIAKDVCDILELGNSRQAISRLDEDEKNSVILNDGTPGNPEKSIVNEAGLYTLILSSRKPEAKQFKRWVTHEVLPQIRQTGSYGTPKTFAEALRLAADLEEERQKLLPKAETYDRFISGENVQKMNDVAKILNLGYGRNTLFKKLREQKILMNKNTPYQRYIDSGYFVVKEKPISMGEQIINRPQTYVTPKGIEWLSKQLADNLITG